VTSIHRTALVKVPARRLFDLVNDVSAYPLRFTWCEDSAVLEHDAQHMLARLDVKVGGMRTSFTTQNTLHPHHRIELELVDGPFQRFGGQWNFEALNATACKISLQLDFEMAGLLLGSALAIGFTGLADRMVDDFCREARKPMTP
jgi:ribosome-associated toxin RatA of RatAB toxin-antitoxin module